MATAVAKGATLDPYATTQAYDGATEQVRQVRRAPKRSYTHHEHLNAIAQSFSTARDLLARESRVANATQEAGNYGTTSAANRLENDTPIVATRHVRPALPPPRRSYSVMEYEPIPPTHRPSARFQLTDLPTEIHYHIFRFLEPIDAACLGLSNKHFYSIHRQLHGSVSLFARRGGPNELEWAWHLSGRMLKSPSPPAQSTEAAPPAGLKALRVQGQGLCRKCGISRCELHRHIRDWVPERYEYCGVRRKFVPRAAPRAGQPGETEGHMEEAAAKSCYRSHPRHASWCGKHRVTEAAA